MSVNFREDCVKLTQALMMSNNVLHCLRITDADLQNLSLTPTLCSDIKPSGGGSSGAQDGVEEVAGVGLVVGSGGHFTNGTNGL